MKFIQPDWPAPDNVKAYTTTKSVWGDETPKSSDGRRALHDAITLPAEPVWLNQTHSNIAVEAIIENLDVEGDASYTDQADTVCVVCTADCLPVLLCDKNGKHVAAIHAGWRGLANGVIESTLKSMHVAPDELLAWLGPAIGPEKFEVGLDVYQAFTNQNPDFAKAFKPHGEQKWLADLYALASMRLNLAGTDQIYGGDYCTLSQPDLFYSYRRDKTNTGRMASLIWRAGD